MPNEKGGCNFISEARIYFLTFLFESWKEPSCKPISQYGGKCCIPDQNQKRLCHSIILDQISFIQAFPLLLHINRLSIDKVNERPSAWSTGLGTCRLWDSCRYSATQPGSIPLRYLPEAPSLLKTQVKFQSDTLSQSNIRPFSGKPHGNL